MRLVRYILGALLLLVGLYVLVGEHLAGTSSDATINARIALIRAPIEGQVSLAARSIGARVANGELVATLSDERFDTARLIDLEREREMLRIDMTRVDTQRAILQRARDDYAAQVADYQRGRIGQIEARIAETRASQEGAVARLREADASLRRANELIDRGAQTAANLDRARAASEVARFEVESTRQRGNYLVAELAAARNGVFIGDSYNDAPFSSQRVREIEIRIAELRAERQQLDARAEQLDRQIRTERVRVTRLTSATLNARVDGIAWDFLVDNGDYARRGQDLVKLVDCASLMVTASVTESLYDRLSIGAPVQFRLFGDARTFDGVVIRLGGSGAAALYANLAVGASAAHLQRFDVTVSVPALANEPDLACAIGRTGRLIFSSGPIAAFRRFLARYGW